MSTLMQQSPRPNSKSFLARSLAVITLGISALTATGSAQAANDYVLTCKPGTSMELIAGQRVSTQEAFVTLKFRPGRVGAASRAPQSGECTWVDRGFRPGEPNKLIFRDNGKWVQSVCTMRSCQTRTNSRGINSLIQAVRRGNAFVVRAHNDGKGHMVITRFGP